MLKSMTGFGRGEESNPMINVVVEIKSVNHRYNDISIRIPRRYGFCEDFIRGLVKERIKRGKIEVYVAFENLTADNYDVKINGDLAKKYLKELKKLQSDLELPGVLDVNYVAGLPDIMEMNLVKEDSDEIMETIGGATREALDNHDRMRTIEGEKMLEDLLLRWEKIDEYVEAMRKNSGDLESEYVERLKTRMDDLLDGKVEVPQDRILIEAAILADKASVAEEIVRLNSHLHQLKKVMESQSCSGKKLDFIVQEMNREANTIGSKVGDLGVTAVVLDVKSEIEKIREQIQNIE